MKCPVCSHVYPDTLSRCSRCGRVTPDPTQQQAAKSTLIEFPTSRQTKTSLPDWRVELNEKVRAIKARRSMEALTAEGVSQRHAVHTPDPADEPELEPPAPEEPSNPIVAAALNRVRRASEQAALATRQGSAHAATARATVPVAPIPLIDHAPRVIPLPAAVERESVALAESHPVRHESTLFDPAELLDGLDDDLDLLGLDSGAHEPLALSPAPSLRAPVALRIVAALVDVAVFCLVAFPFVATTYAIDGDFTRPSVALLLSSTLVLLAAFYLVSMLAIAGRTVGMMFGKLHVVDFEGGAPTSRDILLRVAGYFVAAIPLGLGFVWALFNSERCGWHDLISGTRVVED